MPKLTPLQLDRLERLTVAYALELAAEQYREAGWRWRSKVLSRFAEDLNGSASRWVEPSELVRLKRLARKGPPALSAQKRRVQEAA